jgi:hypothetical protein
LAQTSGGSPYCGADVGRSYWRNVSFSRTRDMPDLIRLLLRNAAIGFAAAAFFVAALLVTDTGGVGTLVMNSDMALLAVVILTFFVGLTFASAQMGFAVMSGDRHERGNGRGGRRLLAGPAQLKPVRVKARI